MLDKIREPLESTAILEDLLSALSLGKYEVMLERSQTVATSRHCAIKENEFATEKWRNVIVLSRVSLTPLVFVDEADRCSQL